MNSLLELLPEMEALRDREAIVLASSYRTRKWTYRELYRHIQGVARELDARGLAPGDRLLLWGENRPEWVAVYWAALARGVTVVPLDFRSSKAFVMRVQRNVEAKLLVHGAEVDAGAIGLSQLSLQDVGGLDSEEPLEPIAATGDDMVQIIYTSGTTGEPRGVVHRHKNLVANLGPIRNEIRKYAAYARPFQPIRFLDLLPLSHVFGQFTGLFVPVVMGGSVAFMQAIHPSAIIETIRRERISVLTTVPRFLSGLRGELERRFDLESEEEADPQGVGVLGGLARWWRHRDVHSAFGWKFWAILSGGAPLAPEDEAFCWRLGFVLVQGYGLTETSSLVATNHPFQPKRGAIGKAVGSQRIKLAEDGEILVRGDNVSLEYFGAGAPSESSEKAWLHTGDLGEIGDDGALYYKGRKKDVIVGADGMNVYPADVEAVLNAQPEIKEAVVVGQPSDKGDVVHAVLLGQPGEHHAEAAIKRANATLEPHQRVRAWTVWPEDDFPRTKSTFKIRRGEVLAHLKAPGSDERAALATPSRRVRTLLAQQIGRAGETMRDADRLSEELGLSSLDRIELLTHLEEQTGRELSEEEMTRVTTLGDLERFLENAAPVPRGRPGASPLRGVVRYGRIAPMRFARAAFREGVIRPLFRHYLPLTVEGELELENLSGPVIFAANHQSNLDTLAILTALPFAWRGRVAPAVQQEYFDAHLKNKGSASESLSAAIQYWLAIVLVNVFPLARTSAGARDGLRFAGALADDGYSILIYPEGRLTRDGSIEPFQEGVGLLAVRLQAPVIPIHLSGLFDILSVNDRWPKRGPVRVRFGEALWFRESQDYREVTQTIADAVMTLARRPDSSPSTPDENA